MTSISGIPGCRSIRGRVGDRVYKTYGDKIIVTRVPRFDGYIPSAAQRDRRDKMRAATAYAHAVYIMPAAKAVYVAAARQLGRHPFRLAVSDFLNARPRVTLNIVTAQQAISHEMNRQLPAAARCSSCSPHVGLRRADSGPGGNGKKRMKFGPAFPPRRSRRVRMRWTRTTRLGRMNSPRDYGEPWTAPYRSTYPNKGSVYRVPHDSVRLGHPVGRLDVGRRRANGAPMVTARDPRGCMLHA
jgi:hypothetical protein